MIVLNARKSFAKSAAADTVSFTTKDHQAPLSVSPIFHTTEFLLTVPSATVCYSDHYSFASSNLLYRVFLSRSWSQTSLMHHVFDMCQPRTNATSHLIMVQSMTWRIYKVPGI